MPHFLTSESVTEGHPDKLCDQISDAILDAHLAQDERARVACETLATTGLVVVAGEITSRANVDVQGVVRRVLRRVGYTTSDVGIAADACAILATLHEQAPEIAQGVERSDGAIGAGDQGLMYGYACSETSELMPLPIALAHQLARRLAEVRHESVVAGLRPDGKTQVTVEYRDGAPHRLRALVLAAQHDPAAQLTRLREDLLREVVEPVVARYVESKAIPSDFTRSMKVFINHTGSFVQGGPHGDCGLTGRKIIVDTYGGAAPHGGGAFSGKDPTKVDRSAAYGARWAAKSVVAAGLAAKCQVQLAYAIGEPAPVSVHAMTAPTLRGPLEDDERASRWLLDRLDFSPRSLIDHLRLRRPIYETTAAYGHFGRTDVDLPWERTG